MTPGMKKTSLIKFSAAANEGWTSNTSLKALVQFSCDFHHAIEHLHMMSQHSNSLATATAAILVHNENLLRLCTKMAAVSMAKECIQTIGSVWLDTSSATAKYVGSSVRSIFPPEYSPIILAQFLVHLATHYSKNCASTIHQGLIMTQ